MERHLTFTSLPFTTRESGSAFISQYFVAITVVKKAEVRHTQRRKAVRV
jgi:hypothetical protein